jgi:pullulanase
MSATTTTQNTPTHDGIPAPWRREGETDLGVTSTDRGSLFGVVAEAQSVRLRLTHPFTRELRVVDLAPADGEEHVWRAEVEGDWHGWSYAYEIERDGELMTDLLDPRARLVRKDRAYIWHDATPVAPRPTMEPKDAIIYELHVRDFTHDQSCGVRPDWAGMYLGLTQRGTRLAGTTITTCLDHILELGVNTVQLMPIHSFSMPYDPRYEWGYMPNDFDAPHETYASGTDLGAPISECKKMIGALHEAGLRVTLDVVYNHNAEGWPGKHRSMMGLAPDTYFRWRHDGTPYNGSGCGNEFRSESHHGRRFLIESLIHWVHTYHVDGFRFDLMGLIDRETMAMAARALHAIDPTILVYGEPWAGGEAGIEINSKGNQRGKGWGVFNDDMRDGLRGHVFDLDEPAFLNAGAQSGKVREGIRGAIETFAEQPTETINYVECHDNHTLEDRLALTHEKLPKNQRTRRPAQARGEMSKLGALALMTSQGIPFLHSGQEFGRTKAGEDNTYNLGDAVNNIVWREKKANAERCDYYRQVIRLRHLHPMFRLGDRGLVSRSVIFFEDLDPSVPVPEGCVAFRVEDATGNDPWSSALVLLNGSVSDEAFDLPAGRFGVATTGGRFDLAPTELSAERAHTLPPHSGAVLFTARA